MFPSIYSECQICAQNAQQSIQGSGIQSKYPSIHSGCLALTRSSSTHSKCLAFIYAQDLREGAMQPSLDIVHIAGSTSPAYQRLTSAKVNDRNYGWNQVPKMLPDDPVPIQVQG
jgi:hypothetical protein